MGVIKVHGAAMSTAAQRVFTCLYEKELNFEFVPVDMASGEHKKEAYLSLNPFGQVPALEHGGQKIFESRAITQYIAMEYPEKGTRLASADKPSSSFLIWKEVEAHQFDPVASKLTWEIVLKPMFGMTIDPAMVEEYKAKLAKVLDVYEARLTKSKYLASDSFTLVDMHHLPTINLLMRTQVKQLFNARPRVSAWVADITARPAWTKAQMISKTNELHELSDEVSLRKERDISLDVSGSVKNVHESISSQPYDKKTSIQGEQFGSSKFQVDGSGSVKNVHESISSQPYDKKTSIQGEQFGSSKFQVDVSGSVKNVHESISSQPYDKKTSIQSEQFGSSKFQVMQEQLDISPKKMEYLEAKQSHSQPIVAASPLMVQTSRSILNSNDNTSTNSDDEGGANSNENGATKSYENSDIKSDSDGDHLKSEDDTDAKSNDDGDHAKSDSDSDAKSEGEGDAKSDSDSDAKSEGKCDTKSNGDGDAKSDSDGDAKSEGKGDAKSDDDGNAKSEGDGDAKSDSEDDEKSNGDDVAKSDDDDDAKSDGDEDAKSDGDSDAKSKGDGDAKSESDGDAKSDGGGDSNSEDDD
ncbi:glutathione S-transferase F8 [Citrus sinensis]|uniref:Glutathione S-transferase F8 n=1 Tax=Citrus sinensis TaxID=2711 RepID=A0ACB8ML77_CITSI|nr:glutathione S-transferase F8 [Citrus sinensis]